MFSNKLATQHGASELVVAYEEIREHIRQAYSHFKKAGEVFDAYFNNRPYSSGFASPRESEETLLEGLKVKVWRHIVTVTGFQKLVSRQRVKEFDLSCEKGDLPDITELEVRGFVETIIGNSTTLAQETVKEVFAILTPGKRLHNHLKTNAGEAVWKIGKKVILTWMLDTWYQHPHVQVRSEDDLIQLDRVFHLLDGAGIPEGYKSPLVDAINTIGEYGLMGETDYFSFRCFQNGNLHLWFKRSDLVEKLNLIAGSGENLVGQNKK
jgi:hypothetical protein